MKGTHLLVFQASDSCLGRRVSGVNGKRKKKIPAKYQLGTSPLLAPYSPPMERQLWARTEYE